MKRYYGRLPDKPDARDYRFSPPRVSTLPKSTSLRSKMPKVYDQGDLGSCTANAAAAVFWYIEKKWLLPHSPRSRLAIYYNERILEGTVDEDSGASIRDSAKVLAKYGAPKETLWPYNIDKFTAKPPDKAYEDGLKHRVTVYARVNQTEAELKSTLASGYTILIGFSVYDSFEEGSVTNTGIVPLPKDSETYLGGHAVVLLGYKNINGKLYWECRNSWGKNWGDNGYFWMPKTYLTRTDLANDFWVIKKET